MTRVLMTVDAVGGVWQYGASLAGGLAASGHEVLTAVLGPPPDAGQREAAADLRIVAEGMPLDWAGGSADSTVRVAETLARLAARERCDVVHLNSPLLAGAARFPAPVVAVAHGSVADWWPHARAGALDPIFDWHATMTASGLAACDIAIAPTRAFAEALRRSYRLSRPIEVVHNGRHLPPATHEASAPFAFTAGRLWDEVKDTGLLDAVAARIGVPFHAAGPVAGPNGERARFHHLHPLGTLAEPELAAWLARRPVFVSAARFEPFGLAVLEAAGAGCPLVLSDIATFRELWEGAALFAPVGDAAGFAAAIDRLAADADLRAHWGERARARAERYGVGAMATAMERVYLGALRQRAAA